MRWNLFFILFIGLVSFSLSQDKPEQKSSAAVQTAQTQYTCPMHSDYRSDKPGECPTCGMTLVAVNDQTKDNMKTMPMKKHGMTMGAQNDSAAKAQKMQAMRELIKKKFELMKEGRYHCCIDGACNHCVAEGGCTCGDDIKNGRPICEECYMGWLNGDGMVEGIDIKNIKHEGPDKNENKKD